MAGALLTAPMAPAEATQPDNPATVQTDFGEVHVDAKDVEVATREGEAARAAAMSVLALANPRFSIVEKGLTPTRWGEVSAEGDPIYVWPFRPGSDGTVLTPTAYLLRHEIGHDLFIRHFAPNTKNGQYGGDAPDWLDEMAAVAFEGPEQMQSRRRSLMQIRARGDMLSMREFLTMAHPELALLSEDQPVLPDGKVIPFRNPGSRKTAIFYPMACGFYDYLVSKTGTTSIILDIVAAWRKGEPLERWIAEKALGFAPSSDFSELDDSFDLFLRSDPRYSIYAK
jgi:hypothetical protein